MKYLNFKKIKNKIKAFFLEVLEIGLWALLVLGAFTSCDVCSGMALCCAPQAHVSVLTDAVRRALWRRLTSWPDAGEKAMSVCENSQGQGLYRNSLSAVLPK